MNSLAGRLVTAEGGGSNVLSGLVGVLDGLGENSNATLLVGDDTDSLHQKMSVNLFARTILIDRVRGTLSLTKPACYVAVSSLFAAFPRQPAIKAIHARTLRVFLLVRLRGSLEN